MQAVKGMVQVGGTTFRIVRTGPRVYEVIRILDDQPVGSFGSAPLRIISTTIEPAMMLEIARAAVHGARTSWAGRLNLPR